MSRRNDLIQQLIQSDKFGKEKEQEQLSVNGCNILKTKGPDLKHYPKKIIYWQEDGILQPI